MDYKTALPLPIDLDEKIIDDEGRSVTVREIIGKLKNAEIRCSGNIAYLRGEFNAQQAQRQ